MKNQITVDDLKKASKLIDTARKTVRWTAHPSVASGEPFELEDGLYKYVRLNIEESRWEGSDDLKTWEII